MATKHQVVPAHTALSPPPFLMTGDYLEKMAHVDDETQQVLKVQLWDTAGQGKFGATALPKAYFRGAKGALLVYDVDNRRSLTELLTTWVPHLAEFHNNSQFTVTLIANRTSNSSNTHRQVSEDEGLWLAKLLRADHYVECGVHGSNSSSSIDACFEATAKSIASPKTWAVSTTELSSAAKHLREIRAAATSPSVAAQAPAAKMTKPASLTIITSPSALAATSQSVFYQSTKLRSPSVHRVPPHCASPTWSSLVKVHSTERRVLVGSAALLLAMPVLLLLLFFVLGGGDGEDTAAAFVDMAAGAWIERIGAARASLSLFSGDV